MIGWDDQGWDDYLWFQVHDKETLKKINRLIQDINRNPHTQGVGRGEKLRHRKGYYSREIDKKNRLVYTFKDGNLVIAQCKGHYDDH